jgi:hypothetical protein
MDDQKVDTFLTAPLRPDYKYNFVGLPVTAVMGQDLNVRRHLLLSKWLNQVLYAPVLGLVKASTLVFMLRIAGHMTDVKRAIYVSPQRGVVCFDSSHCTNPRSSYISNPSFQ